MIMCLKKDYKCLFYRYDDDDDDVWDTYDIET